MLVQTPSKIFKNDFRNWDFQNNYVTANILNNEEKSRGLISVKEIVVNENSDFTLEIDGNRTVLVLPLYGVFHLKELERTISANEIFVIKSSEYQQVTFKNNLTKQKSDVLIFEFYENNSESRIYLENLNLDEKNAFLPLTQNLNIPNFIGLYDGREEDLYTIRDFQKSIFGIVLNGAFEFQNRLMENRDAILLWDIEELEFEALTENALILFFEI